jgi:excisionase family DNA binding protein
VKPKLEFEPLLTPAEAGAYLGVNPRTVSKYAQAGRLAAVRTAGRHRRFRLSVLEAFQAAVQDPPPEPAEHGPITVPGIAFQVCGHCSRTAGEPVAWEACGAR